MGEQAPGKRGLSAVINSEWTVRGRTSLLGYPTVGKVNKSVIINTRRRAGDS